MLSIKKHLIFICPLFIIPLLLVVIWFKNGLIVGGGDESFFFYNARTALGVLSNTWQEYQTGFPFLAWLPRANFVFIIAILQDRFFIPGFLLQAASFYILMVVGVTSVYFLTRFLLNSYKDTNLVAITAALFYLFNPFSVSQVWGRGQYAQYFSFALLPLSLLLIVLGLKKRKFIFAIFLSFLSIFFSTAFGFVTFIIVLWSVLLLYLIYWFVKNNQKRDLLFGVSFFCLSFAVWCLVSSWWLLPLITHGNSILSGYLGNNTENLGTLLGVSKNFTPDIIIRLLQRTYYYDANAFSPIYKTFFFQLMSFIPVVFVLIGAIKILKNPGIYTFRFFLVLLLFGLIISLGANFPLGGIFVWIFERVDILQSFRNPFEKFGLVYALGYSAVFAFGLVSFFENIKYKNLAILVFVVISCGIFAWPMWSGKVVSFPNSSPGVDVPKYYQQLNSWLDISNNEGYRIFMTPIWSGDGTLYQWNKTRYNGIDPMMFLLDTPAVSSSPRITYFYDFIQNIRKYMDRINIAPSLGLLRVKYLINRDDAIIESKEKQHKVFLTESIFPPGSISSVDSLCQDLYNNSKDQGLAWIVCSVPLKKSDWSKIRYLHVTVKTETAAYLELALTDQYLTRIRWDGRSPLASEYKTIENGWTTVTFPLSAPTEYNSNMDFSKILGVEILAYSLDSPQRSVNEIFVQQITLDEGLEEKTNAFSLLKTFGNLQVYKPNLFKPVDEFGILEQVDVVGDFVSLFEAVNREAGIFNRKGFVLESQNPQKGLDGIWFEPPVSLKEKYKFSDTRYWIETNENDTAALLLLSKSFNNEWKVIPGITREMLKGGLFNDINLLKMQVVPERDHFVVNGYANLWKIGGKNKQYAIIFMPQVIADTGRKISIFSIMLFTGIILLWQVKKYISSR